MGFGPETFTRVWKLLRVPDLALPGKMAGS